MDRGAIGALRKSLRRRVFLAGALAGLLGGCGTSPQPQFALPQVAPNEARLVFYRNSNPYDGLNWTSIYLNGKTVGSAAPGTVFYRDLPPGPYHIDVASPRLYPNQARTVVAEPGTTTFVKIVANPYWGQGRDWHDTTFLVTIIDPAIAQYEIGPLKLVSG